MVIAAPSMVPEAHAANANLFVSAESSQLGNFMTGPQVIEVVVIDDDIDDTNISIGEPSVTINGAKLVMAQAQDGNWYGYFADFTRALIADGTTTEAAGGFGLDFGQVCSSASTMLHTDDSTQIFSESDGVFIPVRSNSTGWGMNGTSALSDSTTAIGDCNTSLDNAFSGPYTTALGSVNPSATSGKQGTSGSVITANSTHTHVWTATVGTNPSTSTVVASTNTAGVETTVMNVVRDAKKINSNSAANGIGQINLTDDGLWPFIQLYKLTVAGNVEIAYNKAGGTQSVTLLFDTADGTLDLDRSVYPQSSHVQATIADNWLNIDPTDEDSWTFDTTFAATGATYGTYYQVFNEAGVIKASAAINSIDLNLARLNSTDATTTSQLSDLMNADGVMIINGDAQSSGTIVLTIKDNGDNVITGSTLALATTGNAEIGPGEQPITITETGVNTGIFVTYDDTDVSTLQVTSDAKRGTSAIIDYNDSAQSILVGHSFGSIALELGDGEWNSGEAVSVILTDADVNKNTRSSEDISISDPSFNLIPSLITGDPFTLGENTTGITVLYGTSTIADDTTIFTLANSVATTENVTSFGQIARIQPSIGEGTSAGGAIDSIVIDLEVTMSELRKSISSTNGSATGDADMATTTLHGMNLLNLDVRAFNSTGTFSVYLLNSTTDIINTSTDTVTATVGSLLLATGVDPQSLTTLNGTVADRNVDFNLFDITSNSGTPDTNAIGLLIKLMPLIKLLLISSPMDILMMVTPILIESQTKLLDSN